MLDKLFSGIFTSEVSQSINLKNFLLCMVVALAIGVIISFAYTIKNAYTKSFVTTILLLPAVVCVIILMVNGNIGTGIAVTGAFSLVRFRSLPGTAKEISTIFVAMSAGLICGVGYLGYAVVFALIISVVMIIIQMTGIGIMKKTSGARLLNITIPENLNYTNAFDEIFSKYTSQCEIVSVKTTNMGSMFKLKYNIVLKNAIEEKAFIDELRTKNGNLEIVIARQEDDKYEL